MKLKRRITYLSDLAKLSDTSSEYYIEGPKISIGPQRNVPETDKNGGINQIGSIQYQTIWMDCDINDIAISNQNYGFIVELIIYL